MVEGGITPAAEGSKECMPVAEEVSELVKAEF